LEFTTHIFVALDFQLLFKRSEKLAHMLTHLLMHATVGTRQLANGDCASLLLSTRKEKRPSKLGLSGWLE